MSKTVVALTLAMLLGCAGAVCAQSSGELYQQALRKERTDGDLAAAIKLYQRVAAGSDRELAARALVRVGEVYERMGKQEARSAYERVLREFADQAQSVQLARTRLAALNENAVAGKASGNTLTLTQLATEEIDTEGMPSPDGRFITFTDWSHGGNLAARDLRTGSDRLLTKDASLPLGVYALGSVVSADGRKIAYFWTPPNPRFWLPQLRIMNADGTGIRTLIDNADTSMDYIQPYAFAPDGSSVLVSIFAVNGHHKFGLVSTVDSKMHPIREFDIDEELWTGPSLHGASFSPDGRWIAYDELQDSTSGIREIVITSFNGTGQVRLRHPAGVLAPLWTPDGKFLLFASERSGSAGLWGVRMSNGRPQGEPFLIKDQMPAGFGPMGFAGDRLFYTQDDGGGDVFSVAVDQERGVIRDEPTKLIATNEGHNMLGVMTADGSKLIYTTRRGVIAGPDAGKLVIRDLRSGTEQLIPGPPVHDVLSRPAPSPDGRYIVLKVQGVTRHMLDLIDTQSGNVRVLAMNGEQRATTAGNGIWSKDGKAVYYPSKVAGPGGNSIMRYDVATATTSTVVSGLQSLPMDRTLTLNPQGDSIAYAVAIRGDSLIHFRIVSVTGGSEREIARVGPGDAEFLRRTGLAFTPNGKFLLFGLPVTGNVVQPFGQKMTLMAVPVAGGYAQPAGMEQVELRAISFAPDGRLVFTAGRSSRPEIWVLDNIRTRLPK